MVNVKLHVEFIRALFSSPQILSLLSWIYSDTQIFSLNKNSEYQFYHLLGCIETKFDEQRRIFQHVSRSTRLRHFCIAPSSKSMVFKYFEYFKFGVFHLRFDYIICNSQSSDTVYSTAVNKMKLVFAWRSRMF